MNMLEHKYINVGNSGFIPANEDIFNADPGLDVVALDNFGRATFLIQKGAGATGTATITVESCDDIVPTNATAVAFKHRKNITADTWTAWATAAAAGFATDAGADQMYEITVLASELNGSDKFVRLKIVEVVDSPVDGGISCRLDNPKVAQEIYPTDLS